MAIKHAKTSTKPDSADTSLVRPSDWNAGHIIEAGSIGTAELADGAVTVAKLASTALDGINAYTARRFNFRDDWMYGGTGGTFYQSLAGGNPIALGHHTTDWTTGASILGLTGTGRLGVVALNTGALADARCRVRTCAMGAFDSTKYARLSYEAVLAFEAQASVAEDFTAEIGLVGNKWLLTDSLGDVAGFGHFFRYKRSVGGHKWMAVNRDLDVETAVILDGTTQGGIATVDAGTIQALALPSFGFFRLKVIAYADAAGAGDYAEFYVNDVLCATIDTNMVTHSLAGSVDIRKTAGTTPRYLALDYTDLGYVMRDGQNREP